MTPEHQIDAFLSEYDEKIALNAHLLREILLANLPGIKEQLDIKAKMIGYCYGQKYVDLICVIIPSKKGLKLGFNRGRELPDPHGMLEGTAKISRYINIKSVDQINSAGLRELLNHSVDLYRQKID